MMKRVMCVWFPHWPLQETLARRPEWKEHPVVLYTTGGRGGSTVVSRSRSAAAHGVRPGVPLAQARAFLDKAAPPAKYELSDALTQRLKLTEVAGFCLRYSPIVGLEEAEQPECILMDIHGCTHLFGDEATMADRVASELAEQGFAARTAVADTIGAAWAIVHYKKKKVSGPFFAKRVLTPFLQLPVEALRLAPDITAKLRQLDVGTIGKLQDLPRESLPSRFGPEIIRRLDQALGDAPELIRLIGPPPPIEAMHDFLWPTTDRHILETTIRHLVEDILAQMAAKNLGIQRLLCRFVDERRGVTQVVVHLAQPTISAARLLELVGLRLDNTKLATDISRLHVTAEVAPYEIRQRSLFDDVQRIERHDELTSLIERLTSRLGTTAIVRPQWSKSPQPEFAFSYLPALTENAKAKIKQRKKKAKTTPPAPTPSLPMPFSCRPTQLVHEAAAIDVTSVVPDGPPLRFFRRGRTYTIVRCWGPERIETGWWRYRHVRRDYYRVETTSGERFWLYRQLDDGLWFLHGVFI